MSAPEFRLTMRVRNARLIGLREAMGLNQKPMAKLIGMSPSLLCALETMRVSPVGSAGDWRPVARKVADFHGVDIEWLFPAEVCGFDGSPVRSLDVDAPSLMMMANGGAAPELPDEAYARAERDQAVSDAVDALSEPYCTVMRLRHGLDGDPMTLEEVGAVIGKSGERVRQIEARAIRRLRGHASASMHARRHESPMPSAYREIARDESSRPWGERNGKWGRL